jgi:hypothetical protein
VTKEQIKAMSDKSFKEWLVKLSSEGRISDIFKVCKIRLQKDGKDT